MRKSMQKEYLAYTDKYVSTFQPPAEIFENVKKNIRICAQTGTPYVAIPYVKADDVTTQGYGRFVDPEDERDAQVRLLTWPCVYAPGRRRRIFGGIGAGTVAGNFLCRWVDDEVHVINEAVGKPKYPKGWRDSAGNIFTQGGDYHPDGEQMFLPIDRRPFIIVLSKFSNDTRVSPLNFVAFRFDGNRGFAVKPGVYHQAVFPIEEEVHLRSIQGKVHGVVMMDSRREFGAYMRIENPFNRPPLKGRSVFSAMPAKLLSIQPATESNLNSFGQLISVFDPSTVRIEKWPSIGERPVWMGDEGGVSVEESTYRWNDTSGYLLSTGGTADAKLAAVTTVSGKIYINRLYSRPDGCHAIFPTNKCRFIILLALKYADKPETINSDSVVALEFPPNVGLSINSNVWRSLPLPVESEAISFKEAFSATNAYFDADLLADLGYLIEIQRN